LSNQHRPDEDLSIVENVRTQLEGLKRTSDGALLYGVIERGLAKYSGPKERVEGAFLRFIYALLGRYADDPKGNPVTRVKARLAQQRLSVYIKPATEKSGSQEQKQKKDASDSLVPEIKKSGEKIITEPVFSAEQQSVVTDVEPVQQELVENVTNTVLRNSEFTSLLKSNLRALKLAEKADDLMDLKHLLVRGMEELIAGHGELGQELAAVDSSLKKARSEKDELEKKLEKVSKHSIIDELTGLPKTEAFKQQLKAELGRAKRYGFSLAVSIVDIDNLKDINKKYGRSAGDSVLAYYAREVLSHFRTYDVVARYNGDEFAIMFPNTQKEGAQRALEKAQKHASDTVVNHDGRSIPLPGFSSVLTIYSPGDQPETLLSRAAEALDMAKLRGDLVGQTIISLPGAG